MRQSTPRLYARANFEKKYNNDYTSESYEIKIGNIDNYKIVKEIGRGKFSEVFKGVQKIQLSKKQRAQLREQDKPFKKMEEYKDCVIKVLKPVKKEKIRREHMVLKRLKHENIIKLIDVVIDPETHFYSFIMEYIQHVELLEAINSLKREDVKIYARQILEGLDHAHSKGIIHRDIKSINLVFNLEKKQVKIIDWGLSDFYYPDKFAPTRAGSRYYKAPELLLGYGYYSYSIDVWSFGCVFYEMLTKRNFIKGADDVDQLRQITEYFGNKKIFEFVEDYEIELEDDATYLLEKCSSKGHFSKNGFNNETFTATSEEFEVLTACLEIDPEKRLLPKELLSLRYFKN